MSGRLKNIAYCVGCFLLLIGCTDITDQKTEPFITFVDPMIGTDAHGHTFPGATVPHGMVQLSPSNDFKSWDWCSGYHYSDSILKGFAHNHISGPGLSGLGDILVMPTSRLQTQAGTEANPESGYRSRFSHETEKPTAGYYTVRLDDEQTTVELTTSNRVGLHRYTFETAGSKHIIFDPTHTIGEFAWETGIEIVSDDQIRGYKKSKGATGDRTVYFLATFSKSFKQAGVTENDEVLDGVLSQSGVKVKGYASFEVTAGESIEIQVALSHVSYEGALLNWETETKGKTFDQVLDEAQSSWEKVLQKVVIDEPDIAKKRTFYTALYHAFISPNLISDVDGQYFVEGKIRQSDVPQYSNYSTWDTYRALHPLLTIIDQDKTSQFVNSMVSRHADEGLILPGWEAQGFDNICMIGYNMTSPIADAVLKDIEGINGEEAYQAIRAAAFDRTKHSPNYDVNGMDSYLSYGYVTGETGSSVSKTTEQNYYDWAIGRVAEKLGKTEEANEFYRRSKGWRHLYDGASSYLFPKLSGGQPVQMDTTRWSGLRSNYVSGNIWAYSAYTPHDMQAAIRLRGGREQYLKWLDGLFNNETAMDGEQHVDISGFIGKYGHGDEPGHQMPYLFATAGQPWKTQQYVNEVVTTMYSDQPDGLINNEDLGQMSAWYIFSTLGFYPLAPGDLVYQIGAPYYAKATLNLENGKTFTVKTRNKTDQNIYIQKAFLNGKPYDQAYIRHEDIMSGGVLEFELGAEPNQEWGSKPESSYLGAFDDQATVEKPVAAVYAPFDSNPDHYFETKRTIQLTSHTDEAKIYYTLDGSQPDSLSNLYSKPLTITNDQTLKAIAYQNRLQHSVVYEKKYFKSLLAGLKSGFPEIEMGDIETPYGLPDGSMIFDQKLGTASYSDGKWTGLKDDFSITLNLGASKSIRQVIVGALTDTGVWIFPPDAITLSGGKDPNNLQLIQTLEVDELKGEEKRVVRYTFDLPDTQAQYLSIHVKNYGESPEWHGAAAGETMWLFVDEIIVK